MAKTYKTESKALRRAHWLTEQYGITTGCRMVIDDKGDVYYSLLFDPDNDSDDE
jgi:hypothetical protein